MEFKYLIYLYAILKVTHCAKILAILGTDMNSHFKAMTGVLEALALHHDITFYVNPRFNYKYENITTKETPPFDINKDLSKNSPLNDPCKVDDYYIYTKFIMHSNMNLYDTVFQSSVIRDLMHQRGVYDIMIISAYGTQHFIPLSHHLNLNMIQVSPSIVDIWVSDSIKNRDHWDVDPSFEISDEPASFYGRIKRYLKNVYLWYKYHTTFASTINTAISQYFPVDTPTLEEIMSERTKLVFVNTHSAMGIQKPVSQSVVEIGGSHISPKKDLPKKLEEVMDSAKDGVIYFSLGTVVQGESMNKEIIKSMLRTFAKLKQIVLWKIKDDLENVPDNVRFGKWFPQQDILRHKNTKVFITQGGMLSMIETCTMGVPTLIMPVLFDQKTNAQKASELGYGKTLHFCEFTEEKFYEILRELLTNQTYTQNAKQISKIMQRDQKTMIEKIEFWTKFILEYKGNTVLLNRKDHRWYETMPADIFVALVLVVAAVLITLNYISKRIYPVLKNNFKIKIE